MSTTKKSPGKLTRMFTACCKGTPTLESMNRDGGSEFDLDTSISSIQDGAAPGTRTPNMSPSSPEVDSSAASHATAESPEQQEEPPQSNVADARFIYINVVEAKGLGAADISGFSDPFCKISYGSKSVQTTVIKKSLAPVWGEGLGEYFTLPVDRSVEKIDIKVYDKDLIGKELLGSVTIRASLSGYNCLRPDSDPSDEWHLLEPSSSSGVKGGPGKIRVRLAAGRKPTSKLAPPKLVRHDNMFVYVTVVEALGLTAADMNGKSDPFCMVCYGSSNKQTKVVLADLNPVFGGGVGEHFVFPWDRAADDSITFKMYDKDLVGKELLGHCSADLAFEGDEALPGPEAPRDLWLDLQPSESKKLVGGPGRVRVRLACGTESTFTPATIERPRQEYLYVTVVKGRNLMARDKAGTDELPSSSDPFFNVRLNSNKRSHTSSVCPRTLNPKWPDKPFTFALDRSATHIIVKVSDDDAFNHQAMGEASVPIPQKLQLDQEAENWYSLEAGSSKACADFAKKTATGLGEIFVKVAKGAQEVAPGGGRGDQGAPSVGTLKVEVLRATDLVDTDVSGMTDCFIQLEYDGHKYTTTTKPNSLNPVFMESFSFQVYEVMQDLVLTAFDEDVLIDEPFGMCALPIGELMAHPGQRIEFALELMATSKAMKEQMLTPDAAEDGRYLGAIHVACTINMAQSMDYAYCMQPVRRKDPAALHLTLSKKNFMGEMGRMMDIMQVPFKAPLATLLYMQSWRDPTLNLTIVGALAAAYLFAFRFLLLLFPMQVAAYVVLCGFVRGKMAAVNDAMRMHKLLAEVRELHRTIHREARQAREEALGQIHKEETQANQAAEKRSTKNKVLNPLKDKVKRISVNLTKKFNPVAQLRKVTAPVQAMQNKLTDMASKFERVVNLISWEDKQATTLILPLILIASFVLNILLIVGYYCTAFIAGWLARFGYTYTHCCFVPWLFLLLPMYKQSAAAVAILDTKVVLFKVPLDPVSVFSIPRIIEKLKRRRVGQVELIQQMKDREEKRIAKENAPLTRKRTMSKFGNLEDGTKILVRDSHKMKGLSQIVQWKKDDVKMWATVPKKLYDRTPCKRIALHHRICKTHIRPENQGALASVPFGDNGYRDIPEQHPLLDTVVSTIMKLIPTKKKKLHATKLDAKPRKIDEEEEEEDKVYSSSSSDEEIG